MISLPYKFWKTSKRFPQEKLAFIFRPSFLSLNPVEITLNIECLPFSNCTCLPANTRPSLLKISVSHISLVRKSTHIFCSHYLVAAAAAVANPAFIRFTCCVPNMTCHCHAHHCGAQWLSCASPKMLYFLASSKYMGQGGECTPGAPCNWTMFRMHLSIYSYISCLLVRLHGHSVTSSCQVHPILPAAAQYQASPALRNQIHCRSMTNGKSCVGK